MLSVVDAYTRERLALDGHQLCLAPSGAGTKGDHHRARQPRGDPLRQLAGADQPAFSGVGHRAQDRVAAHSARQADAECTAGKFQREAAGGVPERELVSELVRRAAEDRTWRKEYNQERPHSNLGYKTPNEFAAAEAASLYRAEVGQEDSNAVPLPHTPIPARNEDGADIDFRIQNCAE